MSRTLAIIKPHSVREGVQDEIISMIRKDGFQIIAEKKEVIKKKLLEGDEFFKSNPDGFRKKECC